MEPHVSASLAEFPLQLPRGTHGVLRDVASSYRR